MRVLSTDKQVITGVWLVKNLLSQTGFKLDEPASRQVDQQQQLARLIHLMSIDMRLR